MIPRKKLLKAFGITRKTLEHYKDIDLLCPVNKDEIASAKELGFKPEWQYEDDAMRKLQLIQIFRALDYEPAEIKKFFEESESILDDAMTKLLAKRKDIDGMINIVRLLQITTNIPESAMKAIENINVEYLWGGKNYSDQLKKLKTDMAGNNMFEDSESEWIVPLIQIFFSIIGYKDKGAESEEVQALLWEAYKFYVDVFLSEEHDPDLVAHIDEFIHEPVFINSFCGITDTYKKEFKDELIAQYGEDGLDFITRAVEYFRKTQAKHNPDLD